MTSTRGRKVQRSITLDERIDAALPALQAKLQETGFPYGEQSDIAAIQGPTHFSVSSTIQAAIAALMYQVGIDPWKT